MGTWLPSERVGGWTDTSGPELNACCGRVWLAMVSSYVLATCACACVVVEVSSVKPTPSSMSLLRERLEM